ncbi:hypothetical protein [Cellulomonas sp. P5_C5]
MVLRVLRVVVGVLLGVSGALMYAASWQRWGGACPWAGGVDDTLCALRQDHLYDFLAPTLPWEPVGAAAQLAGWSLLMLALASVPLPWALLGRRPGIASAVALLCAVLATGAVGVAIVRSGLTGSVVEPVGADVTVFVWALVPPVLLVRFAVASRGWPLGAAVALILATPLVATFSYAIGPFDAQPWWEAVSGLLTATAGLCLLGAAAFSGRSVTRERTVEHASRALAGGDHDLA